jgi:hypothetical protein
VAEWRERVLNRLRAAIDAFERGDAELPSLQAELDAAAAVLESPDADLIATLRDAEADLESIRFMVASEDQRKAATKRLLPLREQLRHTSGG